MKVIHTGDWHLGHRHFSYDRTDEEERFFEQLADLFLNVVLSCGLFLVVFFVGRITFNSFVLLALQLFVGVAFYLSMSVLSRNDSFLYLLNQVKGFHKQHLKRAS